MTQEPTRTQRSEGIPLGRIGGVPVTLAWSWFIIAAAIIFLFGPRVAAAIPGLGTAAAYGVALGYALLLLLSVLGVVFIIGALTPHRTLDVERLESGELQVDTVPDIPEPQPLQL